MSPLEDLRSYRSLRQRLQVWGGIRGEWGRSGFARQWQHITGLPPTHRWPILAGRNCSRTHKRPPIVNAAHLLLQDGCDALDALQWRLEG
ncbi:hypothetical protein C1Y35_22705 [Pseudomonas sp. GW456-L14]|nr:hypothetical protein C1Y35_22705 [Pseudomonas sp. GW456-L14]PMY51777.1 hypothetical protein C1Y34_23240 [Pseudomonas sp. GW456-L12]